MNTRVLAGALLASCWSFAAHAGFLQFPLKCSTPAYPCAAGAINYTLHGAYTANSMNSILDHSMFQNPSTLYYPYGVTATSATGGDGMVEAFNGEKVSGTRLHSDFRCVGGTIYIHPDWDRSQRLTNDSGCGAGYASYDEHPGYDYKAAQGTPVYAAATGTVISTICYLGNTGTGSCGSWGALAIRPTGAGNDYFYQYLHMDTTISVVAGQSISAGQQIGTVGGRCGSGCTLPAHLHFEVRHIGPAIGPEVYPIVDPYGWVGGSADPLYSAPYVTPANLWQ
ncbi:MAG TPA: M23 family metallopeptidase [Rhizomicrobium sp.]|nr:M23 family metallopeptidase [Rhizomicrobium sp.]